MDESQVARQDSAELLVRDAPDRARFEITLDGAVVGFSEYRTRPGQLVITHTEVDPAYQGRGFAGKLTRAMLHRARRLGEEVTPLCPYAIDYIRRHPEYLALVDERHRGQFQVQS